MIFKETVVQWVINQICTIYSLEKLGSIDELELFNRIKEIEQRGLRMEKEQIMDAFDKGLITENVYYGYDDKKSEQYYNETFKSE